MRQQIAKWFLVMIPAVCTAACVGGSDGPTPDQTEALKAFVLDKEPGDMTRVDINYDGKITLMGVKVEPKGEIKAGGHVKVTMYWKVTKELGEQGWRLFTHVLDGSGERILNIDNVGPIRRIVGQDQALPPSAWKVGKIYQDEQEFAVPKKMRTNTLQVVVGIWRADERLPILSGPKERDNRGIAATIHVAPETPEAQTSTRVPELRVEKLEKGTTIKIDGKLDEDAWKTAPSTGSFVDVRTGQPAPSSPVHGSAKVLWDDTNLYVGFTVEDRTLEGAFKKEEKDPHLWTKDTVEIMVDPDGDGDNKDYYEIQINPQNLVFDSQFDSYNEPKKEPDGPFGHQEWTSRLKSAVTLDGTLEKSGDQDKGYTVEAEIPWKSFVKAKTTPPALGDSWRLNFYAMENNGGVAWSPILGQGNFHRASRFGKILFAAKGWVPPAPSAAPAGSALPPGASAAPAGSVAAPSPSSSAAPHASAAAAHKPPAKAAPEGPEKPAAAAH